MGAIRKHGTGMLLATAGPSCKEVGVALDDMKAFVLSEFDWDKILTVVCGLDAGWDHAVALTAIDLGVPVTVVSLGASWHREKYPLSVQKHCERIIQDCFTLTWMQEGCSESEKDLYLLSLCDAVAVLQKPGWSNNRFHIAKNTKKLPVTNYWGSWVEAGLAE